MKTLLLIIFTLIHVTALAQDPRDLMTKRACFGCHAQDKKLVGPSFNMIVERYGNYNYALADRVVSGGSGKWGPVPMPANPSLSTAEALLILDYIFSSRASSVVNDQKLSPDTHLGFMQPKDLCSLLTHPTEGGRVRDEITKRRIDCNQAGSNIKPPTSEEYCQQKHKYRSADYYSCMADKNKTKPNQDVLDPVQKEETFCKKKYPDNQVSYFTCVAERLRNAEREKSASNSSDLAKKKCKRIGLVEGSSDFDLCVGAAVK